MILFFLYLLFEIEEPIIGNIKYPESKLKLDIDKRVVAVLKVKMEVNEEGKVEKFEYISSENIEKDKIDYFFNFFKEQFLNKKIKPMKKDGKPIPCTFIYSFSWILYYPPPEVHYYGRDGKEKKFFLKTIKGKEEEIEVYEKNLEEKAKNLIKSYGLSIFSADRITYFYPLFFKEIKYFHIEIMDFIGHFKKTYNKYLKEEINYEHKIFLFPDKKTLSKFLKEEDFPFWADGLYIGPLKLIFTLLPVEKKYLDVLLHEEAHFLINNLLFENKNMPLFLREGFAENLLYSYKKEIYGKEEMIRWEEYKKILKKEKNKKEILVYLFFFDPEGEKSEKETKRFYAFSWAFLEFISKEENFSNFIIEMKKEGFSKEIFENNFGNWEKIEKKFREFIKNY